MKKNFLNFNFPLKTKIFLYNFFLKISIILFILVELKVIEYHIYILLLIIYIIILFKNVLTEDVIKYKNNKNEKIVNFFINITIFIIVLFSIAFKFKLLINYIIILFLNILIYKIIPMNINNNQENNKFDLIKHFEVLYEKDIKYINYKNLKLNEIKKQYKKIAKKYHPDLYKKDNNKFIKIKESYEVIIKYYKIS